jgi:ubiquinone/menaquinone biosynthesis C-methylase UbiE
VRLAEIVSTRERLSRDIQPLPDGDFSRAVGINFALNEKEGAARVLKRRLARPALQLQQHATRRRLGVALPFDVDLVALGERLADDAAWSFLLGKLPSASSLRVLIPGCYMAGEEVQFWLRRGVKQLAGIDVYALDEHWSRILPALRDKWRTSVTFRQASIERMPFEDATFDLIVSAAVLEHVRNVDAMAEETARVLKPGGWALHSFGPLYYSYGADHCIATYGSACGYDHLLLDETEYRRRIENRLHFQETSGNADLAFWAINDQFSFATASSYLNSFRSRFQIAYLVAKISLEGLKYRKSFQSNWQRLLAAGIAEPDLLVKSLTVVLRKPSAAAA